MSSFIFIALVIISRLVPNSLNFAPVGAIAIMSGRMFSKKKAILTIVVSMLISDILLSFVYGYPFLSLISLFVYVAFLVQIFLGKAFKNLKGGTIYSSSIGAVVFYLLTNFGVWISSGMYALNFSGLITCYTAAIPFFRTTLISNVVWTVLINFIYVYYTKNVKDNSKVLNYF